MDKEQQKKLAKLALAKALKAKQGFYIPPMSAEEISKETGIDIEEIEGIERTALAKLEKEGVTKEHLETFGFDPNITISKLGKGNKDDNSNVWKNRLNNN